MAALLRRAAGSGRTDPLRGVLGRGLLCLLLSSLGACASSPAEPLVARVTLRDASQGSMKLAELARASYAGAPSEAPRVLSLASASHTDRTSYYSNPRDDASLKVIDDGVMADLLDDLKRLGFEKRSHLGSATQFDNKAIEIERDGQLHCFSVRSGSDPQTWKAMAAMTSKLLGVYNGTFGGQAVRSGLLPGQGQEAEQKPKVVLLREVRGKN